MQRQNTSKSHNIYSPAESRFLTWSVNWHLSTRFSLNVTLIDPSTQSAHVWGVCVWGKAVNCEGKCPAPAPLFSSTQIHEKTKQNANHKSEPSLIRTSYCHGNSKLSMANRWSPLNIYCLTSSTTVPGRASALRFLPAFQVSPHTSPHR